MSGELSPEKARVCGTCTGRPSDETTRLCAIHQSALARLLDHLPIGHVDRPRVERLAERVARDESSALRYPPRQGRP